MQFLLLTIRNWAPQFISNFSQQGNYFQPRRASNDRLAGQGKFALCFGCSGALKAKNQGLPIGIVRHQSVERRRAFSAGGGTLSLPKQSPHPNAAKSLHHWYSRARPDGIAEARRPDEPPIPRARIYPRTSSSHIKLFEGGRYFDISVRAELGGSSGSPSFCNAIWPLRERYQLMKTLPRSDEEIVSEARACHRPPRRSLLLSPTGVERFDRQSLILRLERAGKTENRAQTSLGPASRSFDARRG